MTSIGIRELRQNASKYLRRVKDGETIEITDHGTPVARLVPIYESRLEQLIAEGKATRAKGDLLDHEPLKPKPGVPLPSEILRQLREHER